MKKVLTAIALLFATVFTLSAQDIKRVAILDVVDKENNVDYGPEMILRMNLSDAINKTDGYQAFTRVNLREIFGEQNFQRSGAVSDSQIRKMGELYGVDYILIAEATKYSETQIVVGAQLINVEEGRITNSTLGEVVTFGDPNDMKKVTLQIASQLLVKDLSLNPPLISDDRDHKHFKEIMIYQQDKYANLFCDGEDWATKKQYFETNLKQLNREHFRIKFTFEASKRGVDQIGPYQKMCVLILSQGWRVLGIVLNKDGRIFIFTDNNRREYDTGLTYTPEEDKSIDLEYDHGIITINKVKKIKVEMNEYNGDNILFSFNNFSSSIVSFYGHINSIRVYNIVEE